MAARKSRSEPWFPPEYDDHVINAVRALNSGNASEGQQRLALDWIIRVAAATYDQPFRPGGPDGDRATAFACGRQFVGQAIVKMLKVPTSAEPTT